MKETITHPSEGGNYGTSRRRFFKIAGSLVGAGVLLSACHKDTDGSIPATNLGSGDTGILNYAYLLEQLEVAFYSELIASAGSLFTADEFALLTDIRDHEITHSAFFQSVLGPSAIGALASDDFDFSTVNFADRNSTLSAAQALEDLGVAAYNGVAKLIANPDYLTIAGKIVSVEARHAAFIRDITVYGTFSDNADAQGLDQAKDPGTVLAAASVYVKVPFSASNLPTM